MHFRFFSPVHIHKVQDAVQLVIPIVAAEILQGAYNGISLLVTFPAYMDTEGFRIIDLTVIDGIYEDTVAILLPRFAGAFGKAKSHMVYYRSFIGNGLENIQQRAVFLCIIRPDIIAAGGAFPVLIVSEKSVSVAGDIAGVDAIYHQQVVHIRAAVSSERLAPRKLQRLLIGRFNALPGSQIDGIHQFRRQSFLRDQRDCVFRCRGRRRDRLLLPFGGCRQRHTK